MFIKTILGALHSVSLLAKMVKWLSFIVLWISIQFNGVYVANEFASLDDAPWHCLCQAVYTQNKAPQFFEGSLISPQYLLTSAGALRDAMTVFTSCGSTQFFGYPDYSNVISIALQHYVHPQYNVGIIKLQDVLDVTGPYVKAINPLTVTGSISSTYARLEKQPAKITAFGSNHQKCRFFAYK